MSRRRNRFIIRFIAVLLVLVAVLPRLDILVLPALAPYQFWLVIIAFGLLLFG